MSTESDTTDLEIQDVITIDDDLINGMDGTKETLDVIKLMVIILQDLSNRVKSLEEA